MACFAFSGSCSLCPFLERYCPCFEEHDKNKRYQIYAVDRRNSELMLQGHYDTRKEVVARLTKLKSKTWPKRYLEAQNIDTRVVKRNRYKIETVYVPYVELVITDGDSNWLTSINLLLNTETGEIFYYDTEKTRFYAYVDKGEEIHIEVGKKWDNKIKFRKHQED